MKKIFVLFTVVTIFCWSASTVCALEYHNDCDQCHILHSAPGSHLTYEVNSETMCMSCHDGSSSAPEVIVHEDDGTVLASCVECHNTHSDLENYEGGVNTSLVGYRDYSAGDMNAKIMSNHDDAGEYFNVAFEASTREFWRSSPRTDIDNGRRVCQVCHDVPEFGMHPRDTDCTASCHTHGNGFMRSTGGGGMP